MMAFNLPRLLDFSKTLRAGKLDESVQIRPLAAGLVYLRYVRSNHISKSQDKTDIVFLGP